MAIKKIAVKIPKFSLPDFKSLRLPMGKKKQILVLEIGEEWLKIAGAEEKGPDRKIVFLTAQSIQGFSELDIAQAISQFLLARNFKPDTVIISHPTHNLTMRILALPSTDPKEIKDIVDLQAVKQTPYTRDEITTDFDLIESDPSGYSRVLVAISHRDVASRYYRIAELARLTPERIALSLGGIRHWFKMLKNAIDEKENILLLDVDWGTTDLLILKNGKIVFSRSLGIGAKQLGQAGAAMDQEFLKEVQRSMESGNAELKDEKIGRLVLTGTETPPLKDLCALLARELNMPCEVIGVAREIPGSFLSPSADQIKEFTVSFAALTGLSLSVQPTEINLLPPEIQVRKGLEERSRDLAFLGTLLLALVMIVSLTSFEKIYKKNNDLNLLKKEYEKIRPEAEGLERLVAKMKLAQLQASGGSFMDALRDVNQIIPDNITLTAFDYNGQDKNVTIRGLSAEMSAVFQFLSTLEATPELEFVKTRNVTKRKVGDKDMAEFEIVANLRQPGPAGLKPPAAGPARGATP